MARKVFISFLGTTNYVQTCYELDGVKSEPVRFIQEALIGHLCKDWTNEDCIMIFTTDEAYEKNWKDGGHSRFHESEYDNKEIQLQGLETRLRDKLKRMNITPVLQNWNIKEGFSESDIWDIFDIVYDKINENDEVYFDVTHAFRSIPLFSVVLFNYAKFMKRINFVSIHYGAFEKAGSIRELINMPLSDRVAPIIDLTSLIVLQNTNVAASNFIEFGKIGTIANQIKVLSSKKNETTIAIITLKNQLNELNDYIQTCRMNDIYSGDYMRLIVDSFDDAIESKSLFNSEKELLKRIKDDLVSLGFKSEPSLDNIEAAIRFTGRYDMIQQMYTLGKEYVELRVGDLWENKYEQLKQYKLFLKSLGGDYIYRYKEFIAGLIIAGKLSNVLNEDYNKPYRSLALRIIEDNSEWIKRLRKSYRKLREGRNDLNHASGKEQTVDDLKKKFRSSYHSCMDLINNQRKSLN